MKVEIIKVENCAGCRHLDHTGAFTPGGAKWCCVHPETCKTKGHNCFDRIIESYPEVPEWCPLQDEAGKVTIYVEGGLVQDVTKSSEEIEVIIRDYDVEGMVDGDPLLTKDEQGRECCQAKW